MAILFFDGFDWLPTGTTWDDAEATYVWTRVAGNAINGGSATVAYSGKSLALGQSGGSLYSNLNPKTPAAYSDIIIGFRFRWDGNTAFMLDSPLIRISPSVAGITTTTTLACITFGFNSSQQPVFKDSSTGATLATGTHIQDANQWQYYEIRIKTSATTRITMKRQGVTLIDQTGITITNTSMQYIAIVSPMASTGNQGAAQHAFFDDLYVVDNSDSTGYLGNVRIPLLLPSADTAQKDFTANSGANNYDRVNQTVEDGDTTYISSTTAGHKDLYDLDNISGFTPNTILGVQFNAVAKNSSAPASIRQYLKIGSTEYPLAGTNAQAVTASYVGYLGQVYQQNPDTATGWTLSDVNALQLGIENVI